MAAALGAIRRPVLANGAHNLTATATDAAANTGAASSALAVTIDTTAPVTPTVASFSNDTGTIGDHITNDNIADANGYCGGQQHGQSL